MRAAAIVLLAAAGCADVVRVAIPSEVTLFGAAEPTGSSSHGLISVGAPPREVELAPDLDWTLFGYSGADLEAFTLPNEAALAGTPVLIARARDACWHLPRPSWSQQLDPSAPPMFPSLVTAWAEQCTPGDAPLFLDVRCPPDVTQACFPKRESDCTVTLESLTCAGLAGSVSIEIDGRVCASETARPDGCEAAASTDGSVRWTCADGCIADFHAPTPPMELVIDSLEIGRSILGATTEIDWSDLRESELTAGSVEALGVRDEIVLATTRSRGTLLGLCRIYGGQALAHAQVLIDPNALEVLGAPRDIGQKCVTRVIADPRGDGFVLGYHDPDGLGVARVDRSGEWVLDVRPAAAAVRPNENSTFAVAALIVAGDLLLVIEEGAEPEAGSDDTQSFTRVHRLDLTTLTATAALQILPGAPTGAALLGPERLLVSRHPDTNLSVIEIRGQRRVLKSLSFPSGRLAHPARIAANRALVPDLGETKSILDIDLTGLEPKAVRLSRPFERRSVPLEMALADPRRGLVSVLVPFAHDLKMGAALASIEVSEEDARILPGMLQLSLNGEPWEGPLIQLQRDGRGRVWAMAPWLGRIVRITP